MLALQILAAWCVGIGTACAPADIKVESDTVQTYPAHGLTRMLIDNLDGSIDVTGTDGDVVEVRMHRTVTAESPDRIREAGEDVRVSTVRERDRLELVVLAPWREKRWEEDRDFYGYKVTVDFTIRVPRSAKVFLKTVNGGDITVRDVDGDFELENVNGAIAAERMHGSGSARTVNGDVKMSFDAVPASRSMFGTVNGCVEVAFPDQLAATANFRTMNGQVFTDFKYVPLDPGGVEREVVGMRKVYRSDHGTSVQIGTGGPTLAFRTLNGDIRIVRHQQ